MSKELVVSATRHETRIAILEDDQVVEIFYQREKEYSLAGSIHKGRVTRVLPGMQSAFVDIGLERDAFLYVSDFFEDNEEYDKVVSVVEEKVLKLGSLPELVVSQSLPFPDESSIPLEALPSLDLDPDNLPIEVSTETKPAAETRPERDPSRDRGPDRGGDRSPDRGGDRGGRGRRGRRRRGGRGGNNSALPDSKFYSPGRDDAPLPVGEIAAPALDNEEDGEDEDFPVLPGESLAKYSPPEASELADCGADTPKIAESVSQALPTRPAAEPPPLPLEVRAKDRETAAVLKAAIVAPPAVEISIVETPVLEAPVVEAAVSKGADPVGEISAPQPLALPVEEVAPAAPEPTVHTAPESVAPEVDEVGAREPLPPIMLAHEAAETKAGGVHESLSAVAAALLDGHPGETRGEMAAESPARDSSETDSPSGVTGVTGVTGELDAVAGAAEDAEEEDEGPEPARIPTSLTAALREQGTRFPHRLSRRARRKMRGGDRPETRGNAEPRDPEIRTIEAGNELEPVTDIPSELPPDSETVATPVTLAAEPRSEARVETGEVRESRPQRGRGERGGRDRGPRPDRGERGPRPERGGERNERGERAPGGDRPERTEQRVERSERGGERSERGGERSERPDRERAAVPSISELLKEGQEIIVQIAKEPLGQKGARITSHIALPGRFLVYMPTVDHVGVSRKIPSDEERQRLKRILQTNRVGMTGGFIVRTAGDGKSEEELRADMHFLYNLWLDIRQKADKKPAPLLLHHDLDLVQRILRDQLTSSFKTIWVDNEEAYEGILRFVQRFQPALVSRVKLYTRTNPVFDEFNITSELEKALRPKVWLKSGGYIVINQTEALVAIDVNTGKYVGKSNRLEDTIVRVNTDAIKEIVRQIRLRDLGGIIVVDFIDMDERKNRQKVMQTLEEAMRLDRAPYKILAFNDFGLVAITRKRVKQSLERTLCTPCAACEGAGYVKSVQTVIGEILQEAQKMAKMIEGSDVLLRVNPEVAKVLKSNRNDLLQEIEEIVGRTVMVKSDPTLHQTKFDLA